MLLRISHISSYAYSNEVFLEPHHLYFHPLYRPYLKLKSFDLKIPTGFAGLSQRIDAENNIYYQSWFNEKTDLLTVEASVEIETIPYNPFDFFIEDDSRSDGVFLQLYLQLASQLDKPIRDWIANLKNEAPDNTLTFLTKLCASIHERWSHTINEDQELVDPNICFQQNDASCRDLSWMMIHMVRHLQIPARFVSGYAFNPELEGHELHGWMEAWVNGAGWVGLDPSLGLMCTEMYIPVAASHNPVNTLPIQGKFRGTAQAELTTKVSIRSL